MPTLTLNGIDYDMNRLSQAAKDQVTSLQFVDAEITRLNATLAVLQTARIAYLNALRPHLDAIGSQRITLQ